MEVNLEGVCRACARDGDGEPLLPMFDKGEEADLSEMLASVTGVRCEPDDGLPKGLCAECATRLDAAVDFRRLCERSDELFRRRLTSVKDELPSDDDYADIEPETHLKTEEPSAPVGVHACKECGKSYASSKSLRRHEAAHRDGLPCDRCERAFARRDHLRKHLKRVHAVADLDEALDAISAAAWLKRDCRLCGADAPNKAAMAKHLRECRGNRPTGETAHDDQDEDDDGETEDDSDDDPTAPTTGRASGSGNGAVATIKEERVGLGDSEETRLVLEVVYKCDPCGVEYDNQHSYAAHMTKHSRLPAKGLNHFECDSCPKAFRRRKNLKQHRLVHNDEKANKCNVCQRAFNRPDQLVLHMNDHLGKKRHQCPQCDKGFNMLSSLKDHLRIHSGEKPYLCSVCGKGFSQSTNLKQHLMRHSAIKPFGCPACRSKFVSKGELDAHLRKHTGEHPFVCDVCKSGFTTSSSLVKHRRIHSGERPYACDLCPLRFAALNTMKNHRRTHTGEKPYECSYCGRAFTQRSDMVSHVRTHTGEKPYVCNVCGLHFQQSSMLKTHMKSHRTDENKSIEILLPTLIMESVPNEMM